jgi:hypothetical protein
MRTKPSAMQERMETYTPVVCHCFAEAVFRGALHCLFQAVAHQQWHTH